jgi:microcystin degradation protein MlrC
MARFALAGFLHETNTFAPGLTPFEAFTESVGDETGMRRGEEILEFKDIGVSMTHRPAGWELHAARSGSRWVPAFMFLTSWSIPRRQFPAF